MVGPARNKLRARIGRGRGWVALRLEGVIDEYNGLASLSSTLGDGGGDLFVDLGGVRRINSVGVRDWVLWLRDAVGRYQQVVLYDCSTAIMNEVNLVRNFAAGAVIHTFQAPYYCFNCGRESTEVLSAHTMAQTSPLRAPTFPCDTQPDCNNALDDDEETYFAFLEDQTAPTDQAAIDTHVAAARAALADPGVESIELGGAPAPSPFPRLNLDAIGAQTRETVVAPSPLPPPTSFVMPAGPPPTEPEGETDVVFVMALVAMLAALGVLVYLIATLE